MLPSSENNAAPAPAWAACCAALSPYCPVPAKRASRNRCIAGKKDFGMKVPITVARPSSSSFSSLAFIRGAPPSFVPSSVVLTRTPSTRFPGSCICHCTLDSFGSCFILVFRLALTEISRFQQQHQHHHHHHQQEPYQAPLRLPRVSILLALAHCLPPPPIGPRSRSIVARAPSASNLPGVTCSKLKKNRPLSQPAPPGSRLHHVSKSPRSPLGPLGAPTSTRFRAPAQK